MTVGFRHLVIEIDFRFSGKEAICSHRGKQIHQKIVYTPMPLMNKLSHIFKHIVDGFDNASFAEHNLVVKWHQTLFHVASQAGDDMNPVVPETSEQSL